MKNKTIALVGNPNSGKTTLFNSLTGANQHIGNWPGVTVEKKEGTLRYKNKEYSVIDLPGIYSLGAFSEDEIVAMEYVLSDDADVIINVIDSSNIERNLYLTSQLLEIGKNVVVVLNMSDEAKKRQIHFDLDGLSKKLGVPVVTAVAHKGEGRLSLIETAVQAASKSISYDNPIVYNANVLHHADHIADILAGEKLPYPLRWAAIKVVEGDLHVLKRLADVGISEEALSAVKEFHRFHSKDSFELDIVDSRYAYANSVAEAAVVRPEKEMPTITDKLDSVLINKYLGIPLFALVMFIVFQLTFVIGEELLGGLAAGFVEQAGALLEGLFVSLHAPEWLISFVLDGIISGVGTVIEFVPLITVLYLLLGFLEDSGYMARAAYIWDHFMRRFGLQGKAFISMIIGFGCNVPGIMSTRTMDNKKDRMISMLINPFMSCGAKIPIYTVFIGAFFPQHGALILFSLYGFGIVVAFIMAKIFSSTLFKGETSYFIIELPPYRLPSLKNVLRNMWVNVSGFIVRAGTLILMVVTLMWVLAVLPVSADPYSKESVLGMIGSFLVPLFKPAGFGTWQESVALFAGIPAKEAVVGTLGMLYAGEYMEEGKALVDAIRQNFTPLTALSYMTMVLLYTPCVAVLGTISKETKSIRWPAFTAMYTFAIGWLTAVGVYQIGRLMGFA